MKPINHTLYVACLLVSILKWSLVKWTEKIVGNSLTFAMRVTKVFIFRRRVYLSQGNVNCGEIRISNIPIKTRKGPSLTFSIKLRLCAFYLIDKGSKRPHSWINIITIGKCLLVISNCREVSSPKFARNAYRPSISCTSWIFQCAIMALHRLALYIHMYIDWSQYFSRQWDYSLRMRSEAY